MDCVFKMMDCVFKMMNCYRSSFRSRETLFSFLFVLKSSSDLHHYMHQRWIWRFLVDYFCRAQWKSKPTAKSDPIITTVDIIHSPLQAALQAAPLQNGHPVCSGADGRSHIRGSKIVCFTGINPSCFGIYCAESGWISRGFLVLRSSWSGSRMQSCGRRMYNLILIFQKQDLTFGLNYTYIFPGAGTGTRRWAFLLLFW